MTEKDSYFGRMNDPTGAAWLTGICGEEIEIYLYIRDGIIEDARYYTEGCGNIITTGRAAAGMAKGKEVMAALDISAGQLIDSEELPEDGKHCAILAVSTLYRAIADYLLKP